MRFSLRHTDEVVGYSDLEMYEPANGARVGIFHPTPAFESLRPIFRRFAERIDPTRPPDDTPEVMEQVEALNGLELTLWSDGGEAVPAGGIFISDFGSEPGAAGEQPLILAVIPLDPDALPPPREIVELPEEG